MGEWVIPQNEDISEMESGYENTLQCDNCGNPTLIADVSVKEYYSYSSDPDSEEFKMVEQGRLPPTRGGKRIRIATYCENCGRGETFRQAFPITLMTKQCAASMRLRELTEQYAKLTATIESMRGEAK